MAGMTVPNLPDAGGYGDIAEPDAGDFEILGDRRFGVISGGLVTQTGSPSMAVAVASVTAIVDGQVVTNAGGTVAIAAAGANPRFDLITIDGSGALVRIAGDSGSSNARYPAWDRARTVIAAVYVPNGASSITNAMVVDKRIFVEPTVVRRAAGATDTVVDIGTTDGTRNFKIDAAGKLTWEGGATDLSLAHTVVSDEFLAFMGSLVAQAVNDATATLVLKAKAGQSANLLEFRSSADALLASVDVNGTANWGSAFLSGSGSPEGVVTAPVGTLYRQTDSDATANRSHLWTKETGSGNTGWVGIMEYNPPLLTIPVGMVMPYGGLSTPTNFLTCDGAAHSRTTYSALFAIIGTSYGAGDGSTTFNVPDLRGRTVYGYDATQTEFNALGKTGGAKTVSLVLNEMPSHAHANTHDHAASSTTTNGSHTHGVTDAGHFHYMATPYGTVDVRGAGIVVRWNTVESGTWWAALEGTGSKPGGAMQINHQGASGVYTETKQAGITLGTDGGHGHTVDLPTYTGNTDSQGGGAAHQNMPPFITMQYVIKAA
jgi:microcystin-dependent protein